MSLRIVLSQTAREAQKAIALGYVEAGIERIKSPQFWIVESVFQQYEGRSPDWEKIRFVVSAEEFTHGVVIWVEVRGFRCSGYYLVTLKDALDENRLLDLLYSMAQEAKGYYFPFKEDLDKRATA
jgi:hypothetical protein